MSSVIELGANIGLNLEAIQTLLPETQLAAVEINDVACEELQKRLPRVAVERKSILEMDTSQKHEMALIKGVLIHINPSELQNVYQKLSLIASRYVVIAEYYNPSPVTIEYRGHNDRLYKRDFAGEFLEQNQDFRLVDYGFVWRHDPNFAQDDTTWFLMERYN